MRYTCTRTNTVDVKVPVVQSCLLMGLGVFPSGNPLVIALWIDGQSTGPCFDSTVRD